MRIELDQCLYTGFSLIYIVAKSGNDTCLGSRLTGVVPDIDGN